MMGAYNNLMPTQFDERPELKFYNPNSTFTIH